MTLAREVRDRDSEMTCLALAINSNLQRNSGEEAMRLIDDAFASCQAGSDKRREASTCLVAADVLLMIGDLNQASLAMKKGASLASASGDRKLEAGAQAMMAQLAMAQNQTSDAKKAAEMALGLFRKLGDKNGQAQTLQISAECRFKDASLAAQGGGGRGPESTQALKMAEEALAIFKDVSDKAGQAACLNICAGANLLRSNDVEALSQANEADGIFGELSDSAGKALACLLKGGASLVAGDFEEARRCGKEAQRHYRDAGDSEGENKSADFIDNIKAYERGELDRATFTGFAGQSKEIEEKKDKKAAPVKNTMNMADITITHGSGSHIVHIDGFESRQARAGGGGGASRRARKGEEMEAVAQVPMKDQCLFAVRWVKSASAQASSK